MEFLMEYLILPLLRLVLAVKDDLSMAWDSVAMAIYAMGLDPVWSLVVVFILILILIEIFL